ncbi:MAG TPA: hypothetical protein VFO85_11595 [Vicinamibacteria bacterium]|nr:hypothetical protein [Vicinamibacteria bacterium]
MKRLPLAAALVSSSAGLLALALQGPGFVTAVYAARWTARAMLPFVVLAFVLLGRRWDPVPPARRSACRAAAVAQAVHLVAIAFVVALEPPSAREGGGLLTEIGGGSAAAVVVAGWWLWNRGWYRWLTYWPWAVFVFTYVFLPRFGDDLPRVSAAPATFVPLLALLAAALAVRVWSDVQRPRAATPAAAQDAAA